MLREQGSKVSQSRRVGIKKKKKRRRQRRRREKNSSGSAQPKVIRILGEKWLRKRTHCCGVGKESLDGKGAAGIDHLFIR